MIRTVVGTAFDGTCGALTIGKTEIAILSFSYGDNIKSEWIVEVGQQVPSAETPGLYETTEGKLKIRSEVARASLFPLLPQFGAGNALTQAVVNYSHPNIGSDSDLLMGFRILGTAASLENSAKPLEMELAVKYRYVLWTNKRIGFGAAGGKVTGTLRL